ncbi:MAG TPA: PASTA domain-containing protein, partial [Bacteroidetes bacterium]|nr:PASTA domain-containing protein [Bacteroidota bacterium]
ELYEPGSTFKLIPAMLLLEDYHVRPDSVVDCGVGYITVYDKTIHDAIGHGKLTFRDVLVKSSNVGMIKLTAGVRREDLYNKIREFGFLEKTGVELPGEAVGSLPELPDWSGLTMPNVVIGQGISVNMLQLACVYGAVANGGSLMKPLLVKELKFPEGDVERTLSSRVRRVMRTETAALMRQILNDVVERGTGRRAQIKGMSIAGKTGTAQMVNLERGGYYNDRFLASFLGFFPVESPRYLILISMVNPHGPNGEHTGGAVCAPVFKRIAERILGLKPELWTLNSSGSDASSPSRRIIVPDLERKTYAEANEVLNSIGLKVVRHGSGTVCDQVPAPGTTAMKGDVVHVTLSPENRSLNAMVIMPVLTGLSLRDAVKKAMDSGLMVKISGTGRVVRQTPVSGARIMVGETCSLKAVG